MICYWEKKHYCTHEPIVKPASVLDYNKNMDLVDNKVDMQIYFTNSVGKSMIRCKKLFFHTLNIGV